MARVKLGGRFKIGFFGKLADGGGGWIPTELRQPIIIMRARSLSICVSKGGRGDITIPFGSATVAMAAVAAVAAAIVTMAIVAAVAAVVGRSGRRRCC